jgi:hypothetical protein
MELTAKDRGDLLIDALVWNQILMDNIYETDTGYAMKAMEKYLEINNKYRTSVSQTEGQTKCPDPEIKKCEFKYESDPNLIYEDDEDYITIEEEESGVITGEGEEGGEP